MPHGLAQRLREGTWALHTAAERAGVMPALLRGQLPADRFQCLQRSLLAVYEALESGLQRHAAHPALAPLPAADLVRSPALRQDLSALHGPHWATALPVAPAADDYARHLAHLTDRQPQALAAHAYVRYLGDLAGGQALGRVVRLAYGLGSGPGASFFDFGPPAQVAALSQAVRQALDALPLDEPGVQALVAEAQWAFGQHVRLFEQLAGNDTPAA